MFELSPADGVRALPRLLKLAAKRGLYVEVVALTGTRDRTFDEARHVRAVAEVCARAPNALIELANEPGHPSQSDRVHDPAFLQELAKGVPAGVPVSLGSIEWHEGFAAGTSITWHAPSTRDWVAELSTGADLMRRFRKPVVSDEPIGAADAAVPGRRDNSPARFRAAAVQTKRLGLGATFHYERGLHARLPTRIELACLDAWLEGLGAPISVPPAPAPTSRRSRSEKSPRFSGSPLRWDAARPAR